MPENITHEDAQHALDLVTEICRSVGPGLPGSAQERERAAILKRELESHLGTENVAVEEFTLAPGAFLTVFPISALGMLSAVMLNLAVGRLAGAAAWLSASAALAISICAPLLIIFEYMRYDELIDAILRKQQSVNVIGRLRKPGTTHVKRLLIVSGHHDSAQENTWIRFLSYGFYLTIPTIFAGFAALLVISAIQLTGAITGNASLVRAGTAGWAIIAYPIAPAIIFGMFFTRGKKGGGVVPGAVDNLSACALAAAMCRFLVRNPAYIPDDTEIRFISFGSEEAGLRGSRRYVQRHLEELKHLQARVLNCEMVAYREISITTTDVNGVKNSPEMIESLAAAAERAGVPYKVRPYPTGGGGSDAGSFSQAGLKAATLLPFQIPQQIVAFHHQKWDRPEVLTIEPLLNVLKLTLEWIRSGVEPAKQPPRTVN